MLCIAAHPKYGAMNSVDEPGTDSLNAKIMQTNLEEIQKDRNNKFIYFSLLSLILPRNFTNFISGLEKGNFHKTILKRRLDL